MKHGALFNGLGGFQLAAEWAGWDNVFSSEISYFCNTITKYHFPNCTQHYDITKTDFTIYRGRVNVLSGGFPCQGFSVAGLRLGTDDNRYLWPSYLRAIDEIQPDWVVGENVTGILSMEDKSGIYRDVFAKVDHRKITRLYPVDYYQAIYTRQAKMLVNSICESLEERGYEVQTFAIPAASVGAPHKRERIWFIAHRGRIAGDRGQGEQFGNSVNNREDGKREEAADQFERSHKAGIDTNSSDTRAEGMHRGGEDGIHESQPTPNTQARIKPGCTGRRRDATDTIGNGSAKSGSEYQSEQFDKNGEEGSIPADANEPGSQEHARRWCRSVFESTESYKGSKPGRDNSARIGWENWPTKPPICSGNDGISERLDAITFSKWRNESIKGAGNALVPQIPFEFFKIIDTISKM